MKKLILFLVVIISIIGLFIYTYNKPRGYEISYELDEFNVSEKYDTDDKYYYFKISKDDYVYEYNLDIKYMSARRIIEEIKVTDNDSTKCIKPIIKDVKDVDAICYTGSMYVTAAIANNEKDEENKSSDDLCVLAYRYL